MKTLFAAAAALGLSFATAYADGGAGQTQFTNMETQLAAAAHAKRHPVVAPVQAPEFDVYTTRQNQGVWLFAPNPYGGSND